LGKKQKVKSLEKFFYCHYETPRRSCGNLSSDGFEITTLFCFRKTSRDDIL